MGLLSCHTVINQRTSRLNDSLVTASLCAGMLCSFCPDVASQISTAPVGTAGGASHFPSGLTAIAKEEPHTMRDTPSETNGHDQTLPIFCGADLPSLNASQNAAKPFPCGTLAATSHLFVFQIFSA